MEEHFGKPPELEGQFVAELLDIGEYPSNIGEVAALSDRQLLVIRRDWHELTHFRLEPLDITGCSFIDYRRETAWYRVLAAAACFGAALVAAWLLVTGWGGDPARITPLIIGMIALTSFGVRLVTSTHRHVIRFEMPGETLTWRSPAIDFKEKAGAAQAVREFARSRGILRE